MKKLGNNALLILFCIGIIVGLILPRWFSVNSNLDFSILNIRSFRQYIVVETDYSSVLRSAVRSRLTLMLLLFFLLYGSRFLDISQYLSGNGIVFRTVIRFERGADAVLGNCISALCHFPTMAALRDGRYKTWRFYGKEKKSHGAVQWECDIFIQPENIFGFSDYIGDYLWRYRM